MMYGKVSKGPMKSSASMGVAGTRKGKNMGAAKSNAGDAMSKMKDLASKLATNESQYKSAKIAKLKAGMKDPKPMVVGSVSKSSAGPSNAAKLKDATTGNVAAFKSPSSGGSNAAKFKGAIARPGSSLIPSAMAKTKRVSTSPGMKAADARGAAMKKKFG